MTGYVTCCTQAPPILMTRSQVVPLCLTALNDRLRDVLYSSSSHPDDALSSGPPVSDCSQ